MYLLSSIIFLYYTASSLAQTSVLPDVYLPPIQTVKVVPEPQEINYSSQSYTLPTSAVINLSQALDESKAC